MGQRPWRGHTNPLRTSPAVQSYHLEFKGDEYRRNFEPPQQDYPAASVAYSLTAAYRPGFGRQVTWLRDKKCQTIPPSKWALVFDAA
jgi:hypothetical protein